MGSSAGPPHAEPHPLGGSAGVSAWLVEGTREVREAASVFNRMAAELSGQFEERGPMIAAISHDLRMPLTRMRLVVEDDGSGIPEAELERVRQPFRRVEGSRNRDTGGRGLRWC